MTEDHSIIASVRSRRIRELQARVEELEQLVREMVDLLESMCFPDMPYHVESVKEILSRPLVKEIMEAK